jgi:hypothetical protein
MKRARLCALAAAIVIGCDGNPTQLQAEPCPPDTGALSVSVGPGLTPVIDWEPSCAVAMVLIEEGASDQWLVSTDDALWDDPAQANLIQPPVTYGVVPAGAEQSGPPLSLRAGGTYEVILWHVLAEGSTATCLQRFESACLGAIYEFQR